MGRRRVRAGARAGRRSRPLPSPACEGGTSRTALRHRPPRGPAGNPMRTVFRWTRLAAAAATLAAVVWHLGPGPFLDGVRAVDGRALLVAGGIGLVTTVCCGWRWTIVARGLG